jgi:hypothetical protein
MKTPLVFWSTMKIVTMIFSKGLGIACHALCINYKYSYQYAYTVKPLEYSFPFPRTSSEDSGCLLLYIPGSAIFSKGLGCHALYKLQKII